jgi:hypothetical protein
LGVCLGHLPESITHRYVSAHPDGIDAEAVVDELTALFVGYLLGNRSQG